MTGDDVAVQQLPAYHRALAAGADAFGPDWIPTVRAIAPGRIELLGNHTDYNGGPVLAAAIDRQMVVLLDEVGTPGELQAVAADFDGPATTLRGENLANWRNDGPPTEPFDYLRGLVAAVKSRDGLPLRDGVRVAFSGDVPIGFGLSSSAALCVGLTLSLVPATLRVTEVVLLAQEAEHRAGTPCGTMDQSASAAGGVIRFDGATLGVDRLSPDLDGFVFAVADSGVDRSLGASAYPVRVRESNEIRRLATEALGVAVLHPALMDGEQLTRLTAGPEPVLNATLASRLRHLVGETERVETGLDALRDGNWDEFGRLMTASGRSSATDYDVSHPRVEELVAEILTVPGVVGARMMGGGGGGTALTLIDETALPRLEATLRVGYYARYDLTDRSDLIQRCRFADGARLLN